MARKRSRKRKKNRGPTPPRRHPDRLEHPLLDPPADDLSPAKLSDALLEFVSPLSGEMLDLDTARAALHLGALAWNLGLLTRRERVEALRELREEFSASGDESLIESVVELTRRKRKLYPHDRRLITHLEVAPMPDDPRGIAVNVMYEYFVDDAD